LFLEIMMLIYQSFDLIPDGIEQAAIILPADPLTGHTHLISIVRETA